MNPKPIATDCHFHIFQANEAVPGARYMPTYGATLQDWAVTARKHGVVRGVIVQPSFLGTDCTQMLAALAHQPETLRGVAVVASDISAESVRLLSESGVRGVRLNFAGRHDDIDSLRALPSAWWDMLLSHQLHVELHADLDRVDQLVEHVPVNMELVLDHFAKPSTQKIGDPLVRHLQRRAAPTWVKLSAAYRLPDSAHAPTLAAQWLDGVGDSALVWGSDWPCTNFESFSDYAALRWRLDTWIPDATTRLKILTHNPARLYWRR